MFENLHFSWNCWYALVVVICGRALYLAIKRLKIRLAYNENIGAKSIRCRMPKKLDDCTFFRRKSVQVMMVSEGITLAVLMTIESWNGFAQLVLNMSSDDDTLGAFFFGYLLILVAAGAIVALQDPLSWLLQYPVFIGIVVIDLLQWGFLRVRDFVLDVCDMVQYKYEQHQARREKAREKRRLQVEEQRRKEDVLMMLRDSADNRKPVDSTARFVEDDTDYAYAQLEKNGAHYGERGSSNIIPINRAE